MGSSIRFSMHSSAALLLPFLSCLLAATTQGTDFDWKIRPSRDLQYHNCYEIFKCARLLLPLDWQNTTDQRSVAIAVISLPAVVSEQDPKFGGTIITNPGGPGGSGVTDLVRSGRFLRNIVDSDIHYEIVSFDPRGISHSTPRADCFGDGFSRSAAVFQQRGMGDLGAGHEAVRRQFARAKAFGSLCAQPGSDNHAIRGFMSTATVARDMVALVDEIHASRGGRRKPLTLTLPQTPMLDQRIDEAKILYLGFSYGTVLGNTFASMFPGRVGRMILDGVEDVEDFVKGTWKGNLVDTEKVVQYFYETCFFAREHCSLRWPSDQNWRAIQERVDALIQDVDENPVSAIVPGTSQIILITGDDIRTAFQLPLDEPLNYFPSLADLLSDALKGNFSALLDQIDIPSSSAACLPQNERSGFRYTWLMDAAWSVLCGDGHDQTKHDISYFESYISQLRQQSPTLGTVWAQIRFECFGWAIRPKWRFTGPFSTPKPYAEIRPGHPAAPLLFVSSRLDPATPLRSAFAMSSNHPSSSVLIQDSVGHCAIYSSPSKCTRLVIQKYLKTGIVPSNGTMCPGDCVPFTPCLSLNATRALRMRR